MKAIPNICHNLLKKVVNLILLVDIGIAYSINFMLIIPVDVGELLLLFLLVHRLDKLVDFVNQPGIIIKHKKMLCRLMDKSSAIG